MYSKDETKLLRKEFWIVFARRCEIVPELRSRKKKWVLYDTGLSGIDFQDVDFHRQNQWPDIFNFFIDNMLILENNFMEIKDGIEAELY